jgi:predicted peroxiredoxin
MSKTVVVCNHADAGHVFPTLIMSTSALAIGDEVVTFFCPGGATALLTGELEQFQNKKGMPDPVALFNMLIEDENARVILCELALEAKDIAPKDLRDAGIEILNAPAFLLDAQGAEMTLTF